MLCIFVHGYLSCSAKISAIAIFCDSIYQAEMFLKKHFFLFSLCQSLLQTLCLWKISLQ